MAGRFEDAVNRYREEFSAFCRKRQIDAPGIERIMSTSSGAGVSVRVPARNGIDLANCPLFRSPAEIPSSMVHTVLIDGLLLACYFLAMFSASWVRFLRYDLR
jgi:hypothetical protein